MSLRVYPVLLRARICQMMASRHPRGMSLGMVGQYVAHGVASSDLRELLDDMVRDKLLVRGTEARPHPREPILVYIAADSLIAGGGAS